MFKDDENVKVGSSTGVLREPESHDNDNDSCDNVYDYDSYDLPGMESVETTLFQIRTEKAEKEILRKIRKTEEDERVERLSLLSKYMTVDEFNTLETSGGASDLINYARDVKDLVGGNCITMTNLLTMKPTHRNQLLILNELLKYPDDNACDDTRESESSDSEYDSEMSIAIKMSLTK